MAHAIFYHKPESIYDDRIDQYYHFPKTYLSRVEQTVGEKIVYYGPVETLGRFYIAFARVKRIRADPIKSGHYYADVEDFLNFDREVPYTENGGYERKLVRPDGTINGGRAVQAVRIIEPYEFAAIIEAGLSEAEEWPERVDPPEPYGLSDHEQAAYERPIIQQLLNRPFRDAKFRQHVRKAYDRTCAFTGLRLINGGGRPEVEAAHIVPVEKGGTDSIRNGIALSGTVHWMFDRGLLSLANDFTILRSRHLNHDLSHLLRPDMKAFVPDEPRLQPHPDYLGWHRENCFKS